MHRRFLGLSSADLRRTGPASGAWLAVGDGGELLEQVPEGSSAVAKRTRSTDDAIQPPCACIASMHEAPYGWGTGSPSLGPKTELAIIG